MPDAPKSISQRELAKHWNTSQPYVAKCIKRGCPTDTLEKADAWRLKQSSRGVGYRSKRSGEAAGQPPDTSTAERGTHDAAGRLGTLRESLAASIDIETEAHRMVQRAQRGSPLEQANLSNLIAAYNKAKEGRLQTEKMVRVLEKETLVLITMDQAQEICVRAWAPLVTRLRAIPRRAGIRANPADDVLAEGVIRVEIEDALTEAKKSFPEVEL